MKRYKDVSRSCRSGDLSVLFDGPAVPGTDGGVAPYVSNFKDAALPLCAHVPAGACMLQSASTQGLATSMRFGAEDL